MTKSHLAIGLAAVVVIAVGVSLMRSEDTLSPAAAGYAPIAAAQPVLVTYSDSGFTPAVLKIAAGTSIRFINTSGKALRIAPHTDTAFSTTANKEFEASKSIKKGESFEVSISQKGVWGYTNLNARGTIGVVIAE